MPATPDASTSLGPFNANKKELKVGLFLLGVENVFKYDGIGLVSNKCSIVLNSNSKYLVTRKHDKVVIGKL